MAKMPPLHPGYACLAIRAGGVGDKGDDGVLKIAVVSIAGDR
jgi:hypothetical protein